MAPKIRDFEGIYADQLSIHSQDRELAPGKLPRCLGCHEVAAKVSLGVGVVVGDSPIGQAHPGTLGPGADIKIDQIKLGGHDCDWCFSTEASSTLMLGFI